MFHERKLVKFFQSLHKKKQTGEQTGAHSYHYKVGADATDYLQSIYKRVLHRENMQCLTIVPRSPFRSACELRDFSYALQTVWFPWLPLLSVTHGCTYSIHIVFGNPGISSRYLIIGTFVLNSHYK
jgi:hypothetical protein